MKLILLLFAITVSSIVRAISTPWRPIAPILPDSSSVASDNSFGPSHGQSFYTEDSLLAHQDRCALYKVSMKQELYFEYIHYKIDLPDIREFTLCMWTKFFNHTNDHPLFSYAVGDQPRGIFSWIANTPRSSYYMLNVDGHNLYRLNYPLRLNKWYHSCQSWNGRTGEWQIWVNDERVGRGFNNRLVGHVIKGGGIAISGQEQRQLGGGFLEGEAAPPGSGGYFGELTMVQLYGIALTVGKAHKDHKHHHAHHYEHDTSNNTPRPVVRAPVTGPPLPQSPFLTAGQRNPQVKINPGAPVQIVRNGVTLRHPAFPAPREPPPQPLPPVNPDVYSTAFPAIASQFFGNSAQSIPTGGGSSAVSFVDGPYRNLFKREKSISKRQNLDGESVVTDLEEEKKIRKRSDDSDNDGVDDAQEATFESTKEKIDISKPQKRDTEKKKRGILQLSDGSIFETDGFSVSQGLENDYFSGLASFGLQLPEYETKDEEREPAEAEVRQVMDICDGCTEEPYEKALIMGWRSVPKKLYSGAMHIPARPACRAF